MPKNSDPRTETTAKGDVLSRISATMAELCRSLAIVANPNSPNPKARVHWAMLCTVLALLVCCALEHFHFENWGLLFVPFAILTLMSVPVATVYSAYVIVRWAVELGHLFRVRFLTFRLDKTLRHDMQTVAHERFRNFLPSGEHPVWAFTSCLFFDSVMGYGMAHEPLVFFSDTEIIMLFGALAAMIPFVSLTLDFARTQNRR